MVRSPELPEWCQPHTLVVVSSYSGDTAETLALFEEAVARGCRIVAMTSGGELGRRAEELGVGRVRPRRSQPRAALGYLALGTLGALEATGLTPSEAGDVPESVGELRALAEAGPGVPTSINAAKQLASDRRARPRDLGRGGARGGRGRPLEDADERERQGAGVRGGAARARSQRGRRAGRRTGHGFFVVVLRHEGEHPRSPPASRSRARSRGARGPDREVWAGGARRSRGCCPS